MVDAKVCQRETSEFAELAGNWHETFEPATRPAYEKNNETNFPRNNLPVSGRDHHLLLLQMSQLRSNPPSAFLGPKPQLAVLPTWLFDRPCSTSARTPSIWCAHVWQCAHPDPRKTCVVFVAFRYVGWAAVMNNDQEANAPIWKAIILLVDFPATNSTHLAEIGLSRMAILLSRAAALS